MIGKKLSKKQKTALITGVAGQDGSYLTEHLISIGYRVIGLLRRTSNLNRERIDQIDRNNFILEWGDVTDPVSVSRCLVAYKPDEIYHLAAQSHVGVSFLAPLSTAEITGFGTSVLLEAAFIHCPEAKFYNAATSELFGGLPEQGNQSENTPFYPRSPYAVSKLYGYWATVNARESRPQFAVNGILFNHESPRRGHNFVTKKICSESVKILEGKTDVLNLGNLDAVRDWGYAPEYVQAMHMMLQTDKPVDLVIGTGLGMTVREFATKTFLCHGVDIEWTGSGVNECGIDVNTGKELIKVSADLYRPAEVERLISNSEKAFKTIGWRPSIIGDKLVELLTEHEINEFRARNG